MKLLAEEMRGPQKINLDDSHLPPDQREELLRIMDEVGTNRLDAMGLEELLEYFPDALALWFWRWLGAGRDGRGTCGAKGTRSESHAEPRTSPLVDAFRV
jgi:hypothetical protein